MGVKMNLVDFLKNNQNSRKVFGQRELKIIEKQLNGILLTQSEKNRLSRDIRKKFEFIKEASKFEAEFQLKKGSIIKQLVKEATQIILDHHLQKRIEKIFLFGSVIENKITLRSDVDIAVLFSNISFREATLFRAQISGRVPNKIDIQVFNFLPDKIKKSILKNSKILYKNDKD